MNKDEKHILDIATPTERCVIDHYINSGYNVHKLNRFGLPDFLFTNKKNGEHVFVEVKVGRETVCNIPTGKQKIAIMRLRNNGYKVIVLQVFLKRSKKPHHADAVPRITSWKQKFWTREYHVTNVDDFKLKSESEAERQNKNLDAYIPKLKTLLNDTHYTTSKG